MGREQKLAVAVAVVVVVAVVYLVFLPSLFLSFQVTNETSTYLRVEDRMSLTIFRRFFFGDLILLWCLCLYAGYLSQFLT